MRNVLLLTLLTIPAMASEPSSPLSEFSVPIPDQFAPPLPDFPIYTAANTPKCSTKYPPEAFRQHIEGVVFMLVLVDNKGKVREARIQESSGNAELDEHAAGCAIQQGRFQPPIVDGKPGWRWQRMKWTWRLDS